MIYEFMKDHSDTYSVVKMAKVLEIHRNRYYHWLQTKDQRRVKQHKEDVLISRIKDIQKDARFSLGTPRITEELRNTGSPTNHKKVARILRENALNHRMKKKFKVTTDSSHSFMVSPNILNRDFSANAPNKKWVSDITYIWTSEGWLYLCVIIDLYSRKVVGWATSSRIDTNLLLTAFWKAVLVRKPKKGLIFHSDRGSQYCSRKFRNTLKSLEFIQSMSRKGNCWDNACAESFFKSLKSEWLYDEIYKSRQEAKNELFEYIEVFYNLRRMHSAIGYETPANFELRRVA